MADGSEGGVANVPQESAAQAPAVKARRPRKPRAKPGAGLRKPGRQPVIDAVKVKAIRDAVVGGAPKCTAAQAVGIHYGTLCEWMNRGEVALGKAAGVLADVVGDQRLYAELYDGVKRGESEAIRRNVLLIQSAGKKSWQAAAWWLERRYPQKFGQNRHELREMKKQILELLTRLEEMKNQDRPSD